MKLKIPDGKLAAFLFDCDGTIADTMPLHYKTWVEALGKRNAIFPEPLFYALAGVPPKKIIEYLNREYQLSLPVDEIMEEREAHYIGIISQIRPIDPVVEVIEAYSGKIPFAVVSGSPRDSVIRTLSELKLIQHFPLIIGAEDYKNGKPAPDCFLLAAKQLNVHPSECLVFEDADFGVEAAQAAGMKWIKIVSGKVVEEKI